MNSPLIEKRTWLSAEPLRVPADEVGDRALARAATLFAVAVIVHNADHLRRGVEHLHTDVFASGMFGIVLEVAIVILVMQRHRLAPMICLFGGLALAAGYLEVHIAPAHGLLSDSFTSDPHTSPLSWAAASGEIIAAILLSVVGGAVFARRGGPISAARPYAGQRSLSYAAATPVALLLIITQLAAAGLSIAQVS
jgi:hypothetical protein